jgi:hypothetical protein
MRHSTVVGALWIALSAGSAQATDYYVSTQGNDLNSGTSSSTPWRTLARVSSLTYQPGDTINLRRGNGLTQGVWLETLNLEGSGTPTNPILVRPYGPGLRPIIAPGTVDSTAVRVDGGGGWKITGLAVANARWGIELKYDMVEREFVWLEDLNIYNMDNTYNSNHEGKFNFVSAGIAIRQWPNDAGRDTFLHDLTIKNVTINNANFAVWTGWICETQNGTQRCADDTGFPTISAFPYIDGFDLQGMTVTNGPQYGLALGLILNATVTNTTVTHVGYQGWLWGTAGLTIARTSDVTIDGLRIYDVSRGNQPDGCGIDFEGGNLRMTFKNSEISETDGAGICVLDNGANAGPNKDLIIENVDVTGFGRNPYPAPPANTHKEGIALHLTNLDQGYHTGELRSSRFNDSYHGGFIGVLIQPYPAHDPSTPFWLNNCCDFSNVVLGSAIAYADSDDEGPPPHPPQHAIDGNAATFWRADPAAPLPQRWIVDLGADFTLTRIEQQFKSSAHWPFKIEGTVDPTWTDLVMLADYSNGFDGDFVSFKVHGQHHWILMTFLPGASQTPTSQEFTVFGH